MLLLLLIHFSRVQLCATLYTGTHYALLPLGFSRQEHWSGLLFPSPMHERESESEVTQSCLTLSDPMDCSLPGSSVHGIFQVRVLEWVAIAFSRLGHRLGLLWYWIVCLGNEQRSFCHFWDCIQVQHFRLFCCLWWLLHPSSFPGESTGVGCHFPLLISR